MKYIKIYLFLFFLLFINRATLAQTIDYKINETILSKIPENITIIGLGDPTHQESTITKFRVDLIKKLVEEKQFKIIAIEGNIYEMYKAYQKFIKNKDISHIENAMYNQLNIEEMEDLYHYVYEKNQKGDSILITGFDVTFSGKTFVENFKDDLKNIDFLTEKEKQKFINALEKANITNLRALFRNTKKVRSKIVYYSKLILNEYKPQNKADYFFEQALKNIIFLYDDKSDAEHSDNLRDVGMAKNIAFLKNLYENKKIILFGSSTHLLKNPKEINSDYFKSNRKTFGDLLNKHFENTYYFIAYSATSGKKPNAFNKPKQLPSLDEHSIEYKNKHIDSALFLNQSNSNINKTYCRFLGHSFLEINLWEVMDGLVLIDNVVPAKIKKP
jgi:erythromycin esterase-like protein